MAETPRDSPRITYLLDHHQALVLALGRAPTYPELMEAARLSYSRASQLIWVARKYGYDLPMIRKNSKTKRETRTYRKHYLTDNPAVGRVFQDYYERKLTRDAASVQLDLPISTFYYHFKQWRDAHHYVQPRQRPPYHGRPTLRRPRVITAREFAVVQMRLQGKTLIEIGQMFGITRERVRQLEYKVATRLKINPHPTCPLCGKAINYTGKTDDEGRPIHPACWKRQQRAIARSKIPCAICGEPLTLEDSPTLHRRCRKVTKHCGNCGKPILLDYSYDRARFKSHARYAREHNKPEGLWFCSHQCQGAYAGTHYSGWPTAVRAKQERARQKALDVIRQFIEEYHRSPTALEVAKRIGYSIQDRGRYRYSAAAQHILNALIDEGKMTRERDGTTPGAPFRYTPTADAVRNDAD